jgi:hypothetical protein
MPDRFTAEEWRRRILEALDAIPATLTRKFVVVDPQTPAGNPGHIVADGVVFPDGRAATRSRGNWPQTSTWEREQHLRSVVGADGKRIRYVPDLASIVTYLVDRDVADCDCEPCRDLLQRVGETLGIRDEVADAEFDAAYAAPSTNSTNRIGAPI